MRNKLVRHNRFQTVGEMIKLYCPLHYISMILKRLGKDDQRILDLGCGLGYPMETINKYKSFVTVGVDLSSARIKECKRRNVHDDYVLCDARFLPFRTKIFDTVLCLEVIEHLHKDDALNLIREMEKLSSLKVIIKTPVGFLDTGQRANLFDVHKSSWMPLEFQKMGYEVRGILGFCQLRFKRKMNCGVPYTSGDLRLFRHEHLHSIVSILSEPLVYLLPTFALCMLCIKKLDKRTTRSLNWTVHTNLRRKELD